MADADDSVSSEGWGYYWWSFLFVTILFMLILWLLRSWWPRTFPSWLSRGKYSFLDDAQVGLSSSTFDLSGNIESGDLREGLDRNATTQIRKLMQREKLTFDAARHKYMQLKFQTNEIGPDGRPTDPRAVFFS